METLMLLQVSENVIRKSADMAMKDPHGLIITLVSVSVVFVALVILYYAYSFVGKIVNGESNPKKNVRKTRTGKSGVPTAEEVAAIALALDQTINGETYAAVGLALHQYLNDTVHDMESYIITIKRK
ncbi:MAG: hypothetical protein E7117_08885 [Bacteroidales bacterium]|nr:hypothetical protein [Bacteroidales bacterium]